MDFALNEDQNALLALADQIFADHCDDAAIAGFAYSAAAYDAVLWQVLADAGLLGLGVAEDAGGSGFGLLEAGLMLERAGAALAPVPLAETLAAAQTLAECGEVGAELLAKMMAGQAMVATAPKGRAERAASGWTLSGQWTAVAYGMEAEAMLVSAQDEADALALFLLPCDATGVSREAQVGADSTPLALVRAETADAIYVGEAKLAQRHADRLALLHCARQLGIAGEALRRTAAYTGQRVQFGRPIGSMQAVQQRAADGFIEVEAMRSTLWRALWAWDAGQVRAEDIAVACYWAAMGGHRVTHTAQHHHGGMGADVTYPIHRFFLAARQTASALGGAEAQLATLGAAIAAGTTRRMTAIGGGFDAL